MSHDSWYYLVAEEPQGPVSWPRLVDLQRAGQIKSDSLVRSEGSNDWLTFANAYDIALRAPAPHEGSLSDPSLNLKDDRGWSTAGIAPWRRYGARALDVNINGILGAIVIGFAWAMIAPSSAEKLFASLETSSGSFFIETFVLTLISGVINGVMIGAMGTTIGKAIFGIKIVHLNGNAIGILEGWKREVKVWVVGMACGLPLISLWTLVRANQRLRETGSTSWGVGRHHVFYRPQGNFQTAMNAIGIILIVMIYVANFMA